MKNRIFIMAMAAMLAAAVASPALAGKRPHPSKLRYAPLTVKTPEYVDIALSNGLTGFVVEDHEIPVVNGIILVRTYFPDRSKYGLNEMARWVMRNGGTAAWPADKLNDELEFLAASIEIRGDNLSTQVSFNCLKKDLARVLEIFADLVENPAFPADKVEMKRKTMLEDIRRKNDDPSAVSNREFAKLIYGEHPYGWEATVASVSAITRQDLIDFHKKYFYPNNAIVGISGDVTKDEIIEALEKALAGWNPGEVTVPRVPELPSGSGSSVNYAYMDLNQAYITIGHEGINSNDPDRCAVNIMNFILGGGSFTSWITEKVRSNEGLAYHAGSRYTADPFAKGIFMALAQTKADACSRATQLMLEEIKRMREVGPTQEEVKKAIDYFVNSQVFDYESKAAVMRRLVTLRFEGRPLDTPQRDMETYAKLTVEDIRRAAQKYLHPDKLTMLFVGNAHAFDRPLSDWGQVREIALKQE